MERFHNALSFIHKCERTGRDSIPGVRRNHVERGSQLRLNQPLRFCIVMSQDHIRHRTTAASTSRSLNALVERRPTQDQSKRLIAIARCVTQIWLVVNHRELTVPHLSQFLAACESHDETRSVRMHFPRMLGVGAADSCNNWSAICG